MKHITYAEKSLMIGDNAADVLMDYAKVLAQFGSADNVDLHAIGSDGDEVTATFLVGPATIMIAETTNSTAQEPDNDEAVSYMQEKIDLLVSPPFSQPVPRSEVSYLDDDDLV